MKIIAVAVWLFMAACAPSLRTLKTLDYAALGASATTIACDWNQTRSAAENRWSGYGESNPVMGFRPSTERVDVYFVGVAVISSAVWLALPAGWKSALGISVAGFQAKAIAMNTHNDLPLCGL